MTNKGSGASALLVRLLAASLTVVLAGCSLDSDFANRETVQTYVRANPSAKPSSEGTAPTRSAPARRPASYFSSPVHPASPVVRIAHRDDFRRYAVAYGSPTAMVEDRSIIPFALRSGSTPLKRFELPFLRKKKAQEAKEAAAKRALAKANPPKPVGPKRKAIRVRTTAYTHNEADHVRYGKKNAIGTRLRFGKVRSAAADWSRYPVGTVFRIKGQPGITYEVDDYGSALVGTGTIDLYKPTFSAMNRWGVRHVEIEVVKWGSFERSLKILNPRRKWSHIRKMVRSIMGIGANEDARLATALLTHLGKRS